MYKKIIYIFIILTCFTIADNVTSSNIDRPHVSLIIHEELLNDFFINIGEIKGEGTGATIDYTWYLLNPRIEIDSSNALFHAQVRAKTDNFRITREVEGLVDISYDKETNQIEININEAEVILDVDIFGKNFVLAELDIAKYFTKSMKIDGPKSVNNNIEYQLPSGEIKEMVVSTKSYNLVLIQDAFQLVTSLDFNLKE